MDRTAHWENVYQTKSSTEVSWYEPDPKQSLDLILEAAGEKRGGVIDVGGGQSFLVDRLLDSGFSRVAVLDISSAAIEATRTRLGERASQVEWMVADISQADSLGEFDIWHDRAVFHFITDPDDRRHYVELLRRSLPIGGHLIVGTFAKGEVPRWTSVTIPKELTGEALESFILLNAERLGMQLGFEKPEDWYAVTTEDFIQCRGIGFLEYYQHSYLQALQRHFPKYDWKPWLFVQVPKNFWPQKQNRIAYMRWLGARLGCTQLKDW